jgi:hypothetical protein
LVFRASNEQRKMAHGYCNLMWVSIIVCWYGCIWASGG